MAAVALVFAGLAALRPDLTAGAFRATAASISGGGWLAAKVVLEILLLGGIILLAVRFIPEGARPVDDALVVIAASLYGYLAEFWGTNMGLWRYYTGEQPPAWIVPAWPLGALLVARLSARTRSALKGPPYVPALLAWGWALLFFCVFIWFLAGVLPLWQLAAGCGLAAAVLASARRDLACASAVLLTGTACVFFADLWGTTNNCWTYHTGGGPGGVLRGILFGAFFDTLLVLASLRTAASARSLFVENNPAIK